jgi:DNA-binding transcriptional MerR regulator
MDQDPATNHQAHAHSSGQTWTGLASAAAAYSPEEPMTIADVVRDFGVTMRALRFYESKRLIAPLRCGAMRLYRPEDRERLALILMGRRLAFTLAEIRELLAAKTGDKNSDGNSLHLTRDKCFEQINLLERQKRSLEVAIAELRAVYSSFYKKLIEGAVALP